MTEPKTDAPTMTFTDELVEMETECQRLEKDYEAKKDAAKEAKDALENKKDDIRARIREEGDESRLPYDGKKDDENKQPG